MARKENSETVKDATEMMNMTIWFVVITATIGTILNVAELDQK